MAEDVSSDCEIVPTGDGRTFHFRVRLSSLRPGHALRSRTVDLAGCSCAVGCLPRGSSPSILFVLGVHSNPALEAASKVSTHMVLLDKTGSPASSVGTGKIQKSSCSDYMDGVYGLEARRSAVMANCVVDNYVVVLCSVDIDWTPPASSIKDLGHDLAMMLDKQDLTDVTFDVGGESISAHRLVLAARSSVFKAQLYGPMAESKMTSITIQDMHASAFRSMLYYIYHGSLSNADKNDVSSTMAQYQHLLVAADRYGLEGLKKNCEDKLCANCITIDSMVSLLELAEDHVCYKLKARCFDFLADGDNFKMVATSGEYLRLMQTFPTLMVEAQNRFKIPHEKPTSMGTPASSVEQLLLDLGHDLAIMFDNQDLTDVSFDVGEESFSAHRLVLAARSPVFKAELYGPLAEGTMTSITIQDMEACTFKSMLHYMYQGSLPNTDTNDVSSTMAQCQHLLVAADRYGVEELKKICEDRLCGTGIMIDNVVSMLELAEDHGCLKLKTECFDFLANGEHFKLVATSAEYFCLVQNYPSLLVEMRNRFKIAHEESTTMNVGPHKRSRVC
ncbi:BTB/POZ and MATH domain-containing protein 1-like [Lolium rigidum]|uniref:BTB/POZ and MATH domain-containing protein 1-like n=1 Tax=Lolium rigidum TaxID=89674 RepID=UPI001F5CAC25|nr:BTB/POZ and MATH domain-containing protein 1-like [Lolium rigidum]